MAIQAKKWDTAALRGLVGILVASILLRVLLVFAGPPVFFSDSATYVQFANQIRQWDFSQYLGTVVPLYPVFLLAFGIDAAAVRIAQMLLGIFTTALLFWITWKISANALISAAAAGLYGFNLSQIGYENAILSESLTTFIVVLNVVLLLTLWNNAALHQKKWFALLFGICAASAALIRPVFVFLPVAILLIWITKAILSYWRLNIVNLLLFLLPALLMVGGWSLVIGQRFGTYGLSTLTGFYLSNHSGIFMEVAPQEYAQIRDIYLRYRTKQIAETGTHVAAIWFAYPDMMQATGKSMAQISTELTKMSLQMFVSHPTLYLSSVIKGWLKFWNEAGWSSWDGAVRPEVGQAIGLAWRIEVKGLLLLNGLFLLICAYTGLVLLWKHTLPFHGFLLAIIFLVLVMSVLQAMTEYGDNVRYSIQVKPLVYLVVLCFLNSLPYKALRNLNWAGKKLPGSLR